MEVWGGTAEGTEGKEAKVGERVSVPHRCWAVSSLADQVKEGASHALAMEL